MNIKQRIPKLYPSEENYFLYFIDKIYNSDKYTVTMVQNDFISTDTSVHNVYSNKRCVWQTPTIDFLGLTW